MKIPKQAGTYVLVLYLPERCEMVIGALGSCSFGAGWYLYVGSAMGGLRQRLARHARTHKRLHWHIDYLLAQAKLKEVWYHVGPERLECLWAQTLGKAPGYAAYAAPLGASDCACYTHLFLAAAPPSVQTLRCLRPDDGLFVAGTGEIKDLAQSAKR